MNYEDFKKEMEKKGLVVGEPEETVPEKDRTTYSEITNIYCGGDEPITWNFYFDCWKKRKQWEENARQRKLMRSMELIGKIEADAEVFLFKHAGKHYQLRKTKTDCTLKEWTQK